MRGRRKGTHISQLLFILDHQVFVDMYLWRSKGGCSNKFESSVSINASALVSVKD